MTKQENNSSQKFRTRDVGRLFDVGKRILNAYGEDYNKYAPIEKTSAPNAELQPAQKHHQAKVAGVTEDSRGRRPKLHLQQRGQNDFLPRNNPILLKYSPRPWKLGPQEHDRRHGLQYEPDYSSHRGGSKAGPKLGSINEAEEHDGRTIQSPERLE